MDYRKFKKLRINLDDVFAYETSVSNKREIGWHDSIYFYIKGSRKEYLYVQYDSVKEQNEFKEAMDILDEYFGVKSEKESRILP